MLLMAKDGLDFWGADCIGWMRDAGVRDSWQPNGMVVGRK
jgi:hypothetical protein